MTEDKEGSEDHKFGALLDYIRRVRGFDFSGYKRGSLQRRFTKRMQNVLIDDYVSYMDYLEVHPEEFTQLFNTILINVTGFFRDDHAWKYLASEIIPRILKSKSPEDPIRIWSAGCASGEEAYSLAMLFCEVLGLRAFEQRVKIYASDLDEEDLAIARHAAYKPQQLEEIDPLLKEQYFVKTGDSFMFHPELRRNVIFGRHDLVQDAPISRLDLLCCRNTLMYLNAETQSRILAKFHFALNDAGFLFLGKAEMLLTHADLFTPTDLKCRVFVKSTRASMRDRLLSMVEPAEGAFLGPAGNQRVLAELSFDRAHSPQLVVDSSGHLVMTNELARTAFGLVPKDIGRPIKDLEISYRPIELRSLIERVSNERQQMKVQRIERRFPDGSSQWFDIYLSPLLENGGPVVGVCVAFDDVTLAQTLQVDLQRANQSLETANEELQSTHEELETTNEELQSTNEELETTNEELQSTNEELETMNEELQSTNEELETINEELRELTTELNRSNSFLQSILSSIRCAVIVVEQNGNIIIWNHRAQDMWGIREEEALGQSLWALDIGLPVHELKQPFNAFGSDDSEAYRELSLKAVNRRGKSIQCMVHMTRLNGAASLPKGIVILMDEEPA